MVAIIYCDARQCMCIELIIYWFDLIWSLTLSWFELFPMTITSDNWNGDCDGDGWSLGLADIEDDGLGVKNDPVGDKIP